MARVVPFWQEVLAPAIQSGERIVIAAHGNSIRALVKYLDNIADDAIVGVNIPNGIPLVYELDAQLQAHPQLLPGRCRSRRQSGRRRGRARQGLQAVDTHRRVLGLRPFTCKAATCQRQGKTGGLWGKN